MNPEPKPQPRKIQPIRLSDVSTISRVATPDEWASLRKKLDLKVLELLEQGFEVELL